MIFSKLKVSTIELNEAIKVSNLYYDIGWVQCRVLIYESPWEKRIPILMRDLVEVVEQCLQFASFQISSHILCMGTVLN